MVLNDEPDLCGDKDKMLEDEFTPREYQSQVLELCNNQNSIVFLPTGSGKTYIAVMLMKRMAGDVELPYSVGGKRTFFVVNTVALAEQQKQFISRHTHLRVGHYTGDMNVDFWTKSTWHEELEKYQILVMTGQIFLDILRHNYIGLKDVNLIVFDECHHAVNDHCMSKIMEEFDTTSLEDYPRVLGLTATLLNSSCRLERVRDYVLDLQKKFRSKIATVDDINQVESFSTNPTEKIVVYSDPEILPVITQAKQILTDLANFVNSFEFEEDRVNVNPLPNVIFQRPKRTGKKLSNCIMDVIYHIENLGIYGGSLAALKLIMKLERIKQKVDHTNTFLLFQALLTSLCMIRKILEDEMGNNKEEVKIMRYSSTQVIALLEILSEYKAGENERGIVFVERRVTARILYLILKAASFNMDCYKFINPDFVVGFNGNPYSSTRESTLENKWNREALEKFQKGVTNIVIASNVLEEGIDIPQCNLVVKYDVPLTYRSYVQSKGRARHRSSVFVLMVPASKADKYRLNFHEYQKIEILLKSILRGNTLPEQEDREEDNDAYDEFYLTSIEAKVTQTSAIPLINRYCSMLPHDKFTTLVPSWYIKKDTGSKYQCVLLLPVNSVIKDPIEGKMMSVKKNAKRSAAFRACIMLHKAGELNDNLLPVGRNSELAADEGELFTVFNQAAKTETMEKPGTRKCRRQYEKQVPRGFYDASPKEGVDLYLHVIEIIPAYEEPSKDNTRKYSYFNLLQSDQSFAILSSKSLPEVCDFSIYMSVGKIDCKFHCNHRTMKLDGAQIESLHHFNNLLFFTLLKLQKPYLVRNLENTENTYLIVPIVKDLSGDFDIDWNVISNYKEIPPVCEPRDENLRLGVSEEKWDNYLNKIVAPWYRGMLPDQMYIVTQICYDMGPMSAFPTPAYSTFEEYFARKYGLTLRNLEQPLFEVKAINSRYNCLKPRSTSSSGRSKRQDQNEDFEEHLVPELCGEVIFPTTLWVKAMCLPSCLHRIYYLLLADELRREIAAELSFKIEPEMPWEPVELDPSCLNEDITKVKPTQNTTYTAPISKMFSIHASEEALLGPEDVPLDIDRERIEDVTLMDLMYFEEYISKPLGRNANSRPQSPNHEANAEDGERQEAVPVVSPRANVKLPVPPIQLLEQEANGGPQLKHILQALTCAGANDALNMERLETLGDSFLKFASSMFLFFQYPTLDEGKLTRLKCKIIGNRNLFYCGRHRNIIGKIKVHEFSPKSDWIPPSFCVPQNLVKAIQDSKVCPSLLFDMSIPRAEQDTGIVSTLTETTWLDIIQEQDSQTTSNPSPSESLIGLQSVPDKVVADCVEALIGAYLTGCGIDGALRLIGWMGALPRSFTDSQNYETLVCSPYITTNDVKSKLEFILPVSEAECLEERIGYTFKDKGYLLQALSHASYVRNRVTECYQRLEFLGDAILDFLITCHIYESCGDLTPGDLTDLRSALVNNITFGSLAVRYGLQKFGRYDSPKLFEKIETFVKFQQSNNHQISEEILLFFGEDEKVEDTIGEFVDVPKVLGDLFESIAGAIYLDSGNSLQTVWTVYYRLMKDEIEKFSKNVPKQPVRMLYEKTSPAPVFQQVHTLAEHEKVMVELEVIIKNEKCRFYGVGENKADAKRAAAKLALRDIQ